MKVLSLRAKLVCALALLVCVAACPMVYFGYVDTLERSIEAAEGRFARIRQLLEEDLGLAYLNEQMLVTEKVAIEKDDIIAELNAIERAMRDGRFDEFSETLVFMDQAWATHTIVVNESGRVLYASPAAQRLIRQNSTDYLGVSLKHYFSGEASNYYRDYFTFLRMNDESGRGLPFLLGIRKVDRCTVLVFQQLDYLEDQQPGQMLLLEAHLRDTVRSIELGAGATLCVVSAADRRILAERGSTADQAMQDIDQALLEQARDKGGVTGVRGIGGREYLYGLAYFKPLDWFIHAAVDMQEIRRPAEVYARNVIAMMLGVSLFVSLAGLLTVAWLLRPLKRVTQSAHKLESFDFSGDDNNQRLQCLIADLPRQQRDEIGQVARAFGSMVLALEKNIHALKESIARQHGIEGELKAAHDIQMGMLPDGRKGFVREGFEAAALISAAREIGGDFFDVLDLTGQRQALILGDVSGKGISAALFMCMTLTLVRNAISDGLMPAQVMKKVNDQLAANNPNCMFVTLWIGIFDPATGVLDYANGGHCPAVLCPADAQAPVQWLREMSGPLVGVFDTAEFRDLRIRLQPMQTCFVYSDGVSEAMNEDKKLFGEKGMNEVFAAHAGEQAQTLIQAMMHAVQAHRGSAVQSDDITMLAFTRRCVQNLVDNSPRQGE